MKRFKKFYIEITNVCNLHCEFCPQHRRALKFMGEEEFSHLLDEIKPYTDYIYLHVKGEPLLHPKLEELLVISKEKGFYVTITTNGTLIPKVSDILIKSSAIRQMNISLHSISQNEDYGQKDNYMKNILEYTSEAIAHSNMIISYRFWNLEQDNEVNLTENKNKEYLEAIEEYFSLPYKIQDKITLGNGIKIAERIYLNQDPIFEWPDIKKEEDDGKGFCYGLRNQIGVLADGTVIPCCLDGEGVIHLGNVFEEDFGNILKSQRVTAMYEGFSNGIAVEELCRKCGYRKRFNLKR